MSEEKDFAEIKSKEAHSPMCHIWKIGSRWGNQGESVLDLFVDYECVFFGGIDDGAKVGHYWDVNPGDLFIISDGATPVAVAKALGKFQTYHEAGVKFTQRDQDEFIDDNVVICKVSIVLLKENERMESWGIDPRKRFCAHNRNNTQMAQKVANYWDKHETDLQSGVFNIKSDTWHLIETKCHPGVFSLKKRYRIPIYQRPYSWGESELRRFVEELNQSVKNREPVFIGTMQLSQAIPLNSDGSRNAYDLIDGQQRISTFIILLHLLEKKLDKKAGLDFAKNLRTIVNRGEAQRDLDEFWEGCANVQSTMDSNNPYIRNATILEALLTEYFDGQDSAPTLDDLWSFLFENDNEIAETAGVRFVVIETRAGLSKTLKIFNTINTAGLDLGIEDLFKVRFFEYRKMCGDQDDVFDKISDIYAAIETYNREHPRHRLSMGTLLATYQRILVVKYKLGATAFNMSYGRFYEMLFDTALGLRSWDEFKSQNWQEKQLVVDDFSRLLECFEIRHKAEDNDPNFRIMNAFFWETRYGYIWDFNVIALFFQKITKDQLCEFTTKLFKFLVPPSLLWAKRVYSTDAALLALLKKFSEDLDDGITILNRILESGKAERLQHMKTACEYEIAGYPKWKMLICKLAEYLKNPNKDQELYKKLFNVPVDIEHIQCYTDEKDPEWVREKWGAELNRLGNLSLLEQSLNRSIDNDKSKKRATYAKSCYKSIIDLENEVDNWDKGQAEARREDITKLLCGYLFDR